jgi:hypothetical protein
MAPSATYHGHHGIGIISIERVDKRTMMVSHVVSPESHVKKSRRAHNPAYFRPKFLEIPLCCCILVVLIACMWLM